MVNSKYRRENDTELRLQHQYGECREKGQGGSMTFEQLRCGIATGGD
jgi:hypothetical protein